MTTDTGSKQPRVEPTDRIELNMADFLLLEQLLWDQIRRETDLNKVKYSHMNLMGRLHKAARRLHDKITEAGKG